MTRSSISFIKRSAEAYTRCHEILGLPDDVDWSSLQVTFGLDELAEVTLTLIPSGQQVRDLAELAIQQARNDCVAPESTD